MPPSAGFAWCRLARATELEPAFACGTLAGRGIDLALAHSRGASGVGRPVDGVHPVCADLHRSHPAASAAPHIGAPAQLNAHRKLLHDDVVSLTHVDFGCFLT